jgi:hypothetical protein
MTPQEWQTIEKSLADLTLQDKLELVTRLMRTIQADVAMSPERTREQLETLSALRRKVAAMPTTAVSDGLSNRDHDRILYGAAS